MRQNLSVAELSRLQSMSIFEERLRKEGFQPIAGVDEAGRGPLAGPVVAAACILPEGALFENLNDSKQLNPTQRQTLFEQITSYPNLIFAIGVVDVETIDRVNILQATFLAMKKAVAALSVKPQYLLIDGNQIPSFEMRSEGIVKGDGRSVSIAAASILAKVTRDQILMDLDKKWPHYGFKQHKGYATEQHLEALVQWGPCPFHRRSFEPIKSMARSVSPVSTQDDFFLSR